MKLNRSINKKNNPVAFQVLAAVAKTYSQEKLLVNITKQPNENIIDKHPELRFLLSRDSSYVINKMLAYYNFSIFKKYFSTET